MDIKILGLDGTPVGDATLPDAFKTPFRPDVIRKAVNVSQANRRQPYGASPLAGRWQTHESWGPGRGVSRVPRLTQGRRATFSPAVVGGRRAHPPRAERDWSEKINKKERALARASALAATGDAERITARGHKFELDQVPLVVDDAFVNIGATSELADVLEALGVGADLERAKQGRGVRAGKGKMRGRRYRTPKSILLVVHEKGPVTRACGNLPGVDFAVPTELNVERLAPGGDAGRLTLYTASALEAIGEVTA